MTSTTPRTSTSRYVTRDPEILQGEPIVGGTKVVVRDIIVLWKSGVKPEEIPAKLFNLVTAAQVFDAISFYLDNQQEIDEQTARYETYPTLNVSPTFKYNPLWDDVLETIEADRYELDSELESEET